MLTDEAKELLIEKGTSLEFGARPLRRAIEHYLEDPLAEELLHGRFDGKDTITATAGSSEGGDPKIVFVTSSTAKPDLVGAITADKPAAAGITAEPKR